ncbi:MAG: integrase family protein [Candidatus Obscuribacterales bacterium]|nr:integrase family protein [Candidatus Obscuribacterales bacterium]
MEKIEYIALSIRSVESLTEPGFYWFGDPKGFGIKVTPKMERIYIAEGKVKGTGKSCRVTIGKHGVFQPKQARAEAVKHLALMAQGTDVNSLKKLTRAQEEAKSLARRLTLRQVFKDYCRSRKLKSSTEANYLKIINRCLSDWLDHPIIEIDKTMVENRHHELSNLKNPKKPEWKGSAQANLAMRVLRALFTYASHTYEDNEGRAIISENPVHRLSHVRAWNRIPRRQSIIKPHELSDWYEAVSKLDNEIMRDYLLVCLFTGLRRNEACKLEWANVDLVGKTLKVVDTKNHQDHILPLSDFLFTVLLRIRNERNIERYPSARLFVFPGDGKAGHLIEPKKAIAQVIKDSNVPFMIHDLRRTFLTIAEGLDVPHYALKRLANHKNNSDVTAGYIIADVERLRQPMQKITDAIKLYANISTEDANMNPGGSSPK